jgi:F0F1-type ATP synthase membrane subunit b/b'
MTILEQLELNQSYFYQLIIFIFALFTLSQFVFKDFAELLNKRQLATVGNEDAAELEKQKTIDLGKNYEEKAKKINSEIKSIFDLYRQEAGAEYEKNVTNARQVANKLIEETRQKVEIEIGDASKKIKEEAPLVAEIMVKKLTGSERH